MHISSQRVGAWLSLAVWLLGASCTFAADAVKATVAPAAPAAQTTATGPVAGWYLRDDFGLELHQGPQETVPPYAPFTSGYLRGSADIGAGVGYQFNEYLRMDATLDYSPATTYTNVGTSGEHTTISALRPMVNAYYDLGDAYGFTPYIGAGIGASILQTTDSVSNNVYTWAQGATKANFAFALMAGASYPVAPNLSLDLGYRFINDGNARSANRTNGPVTYNHLQSHEVRAGLRYTFN